MHGALVRLEPGSPTFQAGSFNHSTRAPAYSVEPCQCRCMSHGFEPRLVQDFQRNIMLLPSQYWDIVSMLCPWARLFTLACRTWSGVNEYMDGQRWRIVPFLQKSLMSKVDPRTKILSRVLSKSKVQCREWLILFNHNHHWWKTSACISTESISVTLYCFRPSVDEKH